MSETNLTFIIATRNRRVHLLNCLSSVMAQAYDRFEVVVVDDGSSDGTEHAVRQTFPEVRIVRFAERNGIGAALERGGREASGDVWINLDDDAYLASDRSAAVIARHFEADPALGALCFRVEAPDGSLRRREIPRLDKRMPDVDVELGYFLGGAVAYRASALKAVGGYATEIGYASEDLDTAFRLFKAGYRMVLSAEVVVVHLAIPSTQNTDLREANYARSRTRIAARYLPAPYAHVHAALWIIRSLVLAAGKGTLGVTLPAIAQAVRGWPSLRRDRTRRLSLTETRRLSALSGRTWY